MHEMNYSAKANVTLALIGVHPMTVSIPRDAEEVHVLGMVHDWIPTSGQILTVEPVPMVLSYN